MKADILSLCIYGAGLLITLFFCLLAQRMRTDKLIKRIFFATLIALPLSIIAGCRLNVGTDYVNYIRVFNEIASYPFYKCVSLLKLEPLFVLMIKTMQALKLSHSLMFGILEFVILFFFALAFVENKFKLNIVFSFFLFYLLLYHYSLNMIRQIMAISIIIYVLPKLLQRKYIKYIIGVVIACMIHTSAIICLVFVVIPMLDKRKSDNVLIGSNRLTKLNKAYYIVILISPILLFMFYKTLVMLPFLRDFSHYVKPNADIGIGFVFFSALLFVPMFLFCRKTICRDRELKILADISLMYIPLAFVEYLFYYGERLSFFSDMIFILFIPMLCAKDKKNKLFLPMYYSLYFIYDYVVLFLINNAGETFPYVSIFSK